ncbi:ligase-associated DNA damage response endonuclease PdeM [Sphingobacterium tabacisoli]|uniref:Ligase-associated DNA damage response endonuclease PdeM n=1 Tax=Sphingobacterium tabacisoli TaxID=2044855 RepID=A0ABW5L341_9SPHI|nr:ligase-associated DNA damage response endonuclease PdeM [Sphingobacterium tabacisoli]
MTEQIEWNGIDLLLLAQKALYIPSYQTLILSDWHLGKLGHFRQEGLFVPPMQMQEDLERLTHLLRQFPVQRVVFLGDLFHSIWNSEWEEFASYLQQFNGIEFILTKGNHDILSDTILGKTSLRVVDFLQLGDYLILSHEALPGIPKHILNIVGHLHPGVQIRGRGRQLFRFPCFYLQHNVFTLPAFGRWTGLHIIKNEMQNQLYAIVGNDVIAVI